MSKVRSDLNASVEPRRLIRRILPVALVLLALLVALPLASCAKKADVLGAWHNEEFAQVLSFNPDGSCTLKTAAGEFEGIYVFDANKGQGTVAVLGESLPFSVDGEKLLLTSAGGEQAEFEKGEMAIAVITPQATPTPSEEPTPTPTPTPTTEPTQTAAATAASTPKPSISLMTTLPMLTIKPDIVVVPADVIGQLVNGEILGVWVCNGYPSLTLEYKSDGTFQFKQSGADAYGGSYTYNPDTNQGVMTEDGSGSCGFSLVESKGWIYTLYNEQNFSFKKQP